MGSAIHVFCRLGLDRSQTQVANGWLSAAGSHPSPSSYLAAVTDFTEIVSPVAVPVTLASSQASLLSESSAA